MASLKEARKWSQPDPELPDAEAHAAYQRDIYSSFKPPIFTTKPWEWEALARQQVPPANFGYVHGSASTAKTHLANLEAFNRYRIRPRMLVNATRRDLSVELFGQKLNGPIIVGPVGVQNIMHPDAEEATARACRNVDIPMILSTAATRTMEQVAAANGDGNRWYQLYWPRASEEAITASLLKRAKDNGFKVLVVTLDTFTLGWRPEDLDNTYLPFLWGEGCQNGHADPVFQERYAEMQASDQRTTMEKLGELWGLMRRSGNPLTAMKVLANISTIQKSRAWLQVMNSGVYREWKDLEVLKQLWDGPIVLKGIQTVEDARKAADYGMAGIIVSNHGGRQVDGAIASLDALAEIGADEQVKQSGITLLFDSGIRCGADVFKAIALGAKAVLIGRPYMYGLAIRGQEGVEHVLKCLKADTDNVLANAGKRSLKEISREDLQVRGESKL